MAKMMRSGYRWGIHVLVLALGLVGLMACGDPEESQPVDMTPTMDNVQTLVFDQCCALSGCHDDQTQAGDLNLSDPDVSHLALVGQPSVNAVAAENGWQLVAAGDPERSFLMRKMAQPGLGEGAAMPVGLKALNAPYMEMVSEWIALGARR